MAIGADYCMAKKYFPSIKILTSISPEIFLDRGWLCQLGVAVTPQVGVGSLKLPHILRAPIASVSPMLPLWSKSASKRRKKCGISENKVEEVSSETAPAMVPTPGEVKVRRSGASTAGYRSLNQEATSTTHSV